MTVLLLVVLSRILHFIVWGRILYSWFIRGDFLLYLLDINDASLTRLTPDVTDDYTPVWR